MKIYCARDRYKDQNVSKTLEDFVGDDIWVNIKVNADVPGTRCFLDSGVYWIRVIKLYPDDRCLVNIVDDFSIQDDGFIRAVPNYIDRVCDQRDILDNRNITVTTPLSLRKTEELFKNVEE